MDTIKFNEIVKRNIVKAELAVLSIQLSFYYEMPLHERISTKLTW